MIHGLSNDLPETRTREELRVFFQTIRILSERLLGMKPGTFVLSERLVPPGIQEYDTEKVR
jgi:hypothetical protein